MIFMIVWLILTRVLGPKEAVQIYNYNLTSINLLKYSPFLKLRIKKWIQKIG